MLPDTCFFLSDFSSLPPLLPPAITTFSFCPTHIDLNRFRTNESGVSHQTRLFGDIFKLSCLILKSYERRGSRISPLHHINQQSIKNQAHAHDFKRLVAFVCVLSFLSKSFVLSLLARQREECATKVYLYKKDRNVTC